MIVDNLVYEVQSKRSSTNALNKATVQAHCDKTHSAIWKNQQPKYVTTCPTYHTGHRPVLDIVLIAPNCTPTPQHSIAIWHALFNRRRFLTNNISQGAYRTGHRPVLDIVLIAPSNIPPKWNRNRSQQTLLRQAAAARPVLMMKQRLHVACVQAAATSPHSRPISLSG